jgi:hypothetical protein
VAEAFRLLEQQLHKRVHRLQRGEVKKHSMPA